MATTVSTIGAVNRASLNNSNYGGLVPNSAFLGSRLKRVSSRFTNSNLATGNFKIVAEYDEEKQTEKDKWQGLAFDTSDDQQDITRGKGLVDPLFQAPMGTGTHNAIMSSYDYVSAGLRQYNYDNNVDGFYIAPTFMDKLMVHIVKNFMSLPNIKVPLILGVWGGKGQGKSFQCELVFSKMGINPIMMSAGELESGNAGEPAKLIRQRYREAADIIKKGKMCCLFINDLDAGAGRFGGTTQYTVNNQMVNATLMNIADNPTNVQLPGLYNKEENPRVPIIVTGNDFSTLYAPLIRDGRMDKFYWAPTREDRIGICTGIFRTDGLPIEDIVKLVDTFPGQSIDFFGALRARVYDDEVRKWAARVGVERIGKTLVNSKEGPPTFDQPKMTLEKLLEYGNMLIKEQENVKRVKLADKYLKEAALGDANEDAVQFETSPEAAVEDANEDAIQSETSNEVALEDAKEDGELESSNETTLVDANEDTVQAIVDTNEKVALENAKEDDELESSSETTLVDANEDTVQAIVDTNEEVALEDAKEDDELESSNETTLVDTNEDTVQAIIDTNEEVALGGAKEDDELDSSNETTLVDTNEDTVQAIIDTNEEVALEVEKEDDELDSSNGRQLLPNETTFLDANEDTVQAIIDTEEDVQSETSYNVPLGDANDDAAQSKTSHEVAVEDAIEDVVQSGTSETALVEANEEAAQSKTSHEAAPVDANEDVIQLGTSYDSMEEEQRNKLISLFLKAVQIHLLKTMSQQPDAATKASSIDS